MGVAQWVGHCRAKRKVTSLVPGWDTEERQQSMFFFHINVSKPLSLPSPLSKIK